MRVALIIAALCSLAGVAHATPASEPHKAYLTLIIDDLGQNLPRDRRVLALPGPVRGSIRCCRTERPAGFRFYWCV
jgi:polysaccharide deacetylase 2 family uncharacterized protein YibQ